MIFQYQVFNGSWVFFGSYNQLLNWLSVKNYYEKDTFGNLEFKGNRVLDYVGTNDNDTYYVGAYIPPYGYVEHAPRNYRVLDDNGISIYSKALLEDVRNWEYSNDLFDEWYAWHKKYLHDVEKNDNLTKRLAYYKRLKKFDFRNGPVPDVHKMSHGHICRHMRTTNERRQSCAPEMKAFNRGTRGMNLINSYDDIFRDTRNRNWKKCTRNRHQWEHGVQMRERHSIGKHVYVVKEPCKSSFE